jgi:membrane fusion protein (multidrug efflux system)
VVASKCLIEKCMKAGSLAASMMKALRTELGNRSKKPVIWICLLGALAASYGCENNKAAPVAMAPPEVSVVQVIQQDVPVYGNWVATLDGFVNAQIQPQVSGYVVKQNYREGSFVHKDDVLFEIDPRPFQAVFDQAQGQLAQARGQLAQASAQLALSEINVKRDTPLAAARAIAQSQLDNDLQTRAQQQASVQTGKAAIMAAEASVEQAQLNLGFTKVRSLVDGVAGIATVQMGNLVNQSAVLTTVSQVNPIKAYFPISESEYLLVSEKIKPGASGDWLRNTNSVPLQLTLTNGNIYPEPGHIIFADRQVDTQTGTIRIVGAFPNPRNILRPGQFGRIRALTGLHKNALLVPQRAVSELQGRYQVAVVGPDNKVSIHEVKVGDRFGEMWMISSGLEPGQRVVSEGLAKVRDGSPVDPKAEKPQSEGM